MGIERREIPSVNIQLHFDKFFAVVHSAYVLPPQG